MLYKSDQHKPSTTNPPVSQSDLSIHSSTTQLVNQCFLLHICKLKVSQLISFVLHICKLTVSEPASQKLTKSKLNACIF